MKEQPTCVTHSDGTKIWYLDGQYHRLDGPAVEYADGGRSWFQYSKLHREDGPACIWQNGNQFWYWDDKYVPVKSQEEFEKWIKMKAFW
jgi:hypothetical protein